MCHHYQAWGTSNANVIVGWFSSKPNRQSRLTRALPALHFEADIVKDPISMAHTPVFLLLRLMSEETASSPPTHSTISQQPLSIPQPPPLQKWAPAFESTLPRGDDVAANTSALPTLSTSPDLGNVITAANEYRFDHVTESTLSVEPVSGSEAREKTSIQLLQTQRDNSRAKEKEEETSQPTLVDFGLPFISSSGPIENSVSLPLLTPEDARTSEPFSTVSTAPLEAASDTTDGEESVYVPTIRKDKGKERAEPIVSDVDANVDLSLPKQPSPPTGPLPAIPQRTASSLQIEDTAIRKSNSAESLAGVKGDGVDSNPQEVQERQPHMHPGVSTCLVLKFRNSW